MRGGGAPEGQSEGAEVRLIVYDLSDHNDWLSCLGLGIFHTGVCVYGNEYAYGGHERPTSGCFMTQPYGAPPPARFREAVLVGTTKKTQREVIEIVQRLGGEKFTGLRYQLLEQNCNHFADHLVRELTGLTAPSWVNRAAGAAIMCRCLLPAAVLPPPVGPEEEPEEMSTQDEMLLSPGKVKNPKSPLRDALGYSPSRYNSGKRGASESGSYT